MSTDGCSECIINTKKNYKSHDDVNIENKKKKKL